MNYRALLQSYNNWMRDHFTYSYETAQRTSLHDPELGAALMAVVDAVVKVRDLVKKRLDANGHPRNGTS